MAGAVPRRELMEMRARLYLNLGLVHDSLREPAQCDQYIKKSIFLAEYGWGGGGAGGWIWLWGGFGAGGVNALLPVGFWCRGVKSCPGNRVLVGRCVWNDTKSSHSSRVWGEGTRSSPTSGV